MNKLVSSENTYPTVLLIEGTSSLRDTYRTHLQDVGYNVQCASTAAEGSALFLASDCLVVVLDLTLKDGDSIDLLREMVRIRPETAVIVLSDGSVTRTSGAMQAGALDFLSIPPDQDQLLAAVHHARRAVEDGQSPRQTPPKTPTDNGFIGQSQVMQDVYARVQSAARTLAPTLITGESGTGKELCARTIHNLSPRAPSRFVTLDCAATHPSQFETELFGYVRGAFPSATTDGPGLATLADGGTLFLDEICELDLTAQSKLLRFMQTMKIMPLGAGISHPVNVRIIASTSVPPTQAIAEGKLRDELFYALQVLSIRMPPLRERREDIAPLAEELLARYSVIEGRNFTSINPAVAQVLCDQPWPGNVRQLMSMLRAITILHNGPQVTLSMLPEDLLLRLNGAAKPLQDGADKFDGMTLAEVERTVIEAAIDRNNGSVPRAARDLAVAPSTIYRKIEAWKP